MAGKVHKSRRRSGDFHFWTDKRGKIFRCVHCGATGRLSKYSVKHRPGCAPPSPAPKLAGPTLSPCTSVAVLGGGRSAARIAEECSAAHYDSGQARGLRDSLRAGGFDGVVIVREFLSHKESDATKGDCVRFGIQCRTVSGTRQLKAMLRKMRQGSGRQSIARGSGWAGGADPT